MTQPIQGWYPDPLTPGSERWWDGEQWSPVTRAAQTQASAGGPQSTLTLEPSVLQEAGGRRLASPGPRLVARLIDLMITGFVAQLVAGSLAQPALDEMDSVWAQVRSGVRQPVYDIERTMTSLAMFVGALLLIRGLYQVTLIKAYGATLGKRLMGVKVVSVDGGPVSWTSSVWRWFARDVWRLLALVPLLGVPALVYYLMDSVWCLRDRRRQALHDKPAKTLVIQAAPNRNNAE